MSNNFLEISRVIISFETENQALQYIRDGINYVITNYDDKSPFIYYENEMSGTIELLNLLNTILSKLQRIKDSTISSDVQSPNITEKII